MTIGYAYLFSYIFQVYFQKQPKEAWMIKKVTIRFFLNFGHGYCSIKKLI